MPTSGFWKTITHGDKKMKTDSYSGKVAMGTGSNRGIGLATAALAK